MGRLRRLVPAGAEQNAKINGRGAFLHDSPRPAPEAENLAQRHPDVVKRLFDLGVADAGGSFPEFLVKQAEDANDAPRLNIFLYQVTHNAALRNAALPIVAMIGLDIGMFMSGAVVVESVFGWPGIGQLTWQAIQTVDIPIIVGVTTVAAGFIVLGNLLADLVAPFVDPRIRLR